MKPSLRQFAWLIARDVNRTVGGGMAAMELLRRTFDGRGWVDAGTHGVLVAVSRLMPGTNILAYCAAAGFRMFGLRGTLAAVAAASLPMSVGILLLAATVGHLDRYPAVQLLLSIGTLIAAVLVFSSAWNLLKPYLRSTTWRRATLMVALAALLDLLGWSPVRVLLACALAGALLPPVSRPVRTASQEPA